MSANMNSNRMNSAYKPPQLRVALSKQSVNNSNSGIVDTRYKVKDNIVTDLDSEKFFSKFFIPHTRRKVYNFGLSTYFDNKYKGTTTEYKHLLEVSTTLYIGNINLVSTKSEIHQLFSKAGNIKNIIMGVEKKTLAPAGFCFIEYETHTEALNCINTLQKKLFNGKNIFIDWDRGFVEGRQYSRKKKSQRPIEFYPSF